MHKRLLLLFVICTSFSVSFSQVNDPDKYAEMIDSADLKRHLTIIAGDEMEGRETGTEGQRNAASYIEKQFKDFGLKASDSLGGYLQYFPLFYDSMTYSTVKIGNKKLQYGKDYYVHAQHNQSIKSTASKIVFAGYGISDSAYDDYKGKNVKGKIVVFFLGEPRMEDKSLVTGTSEISKYSYPRMGAKLQTAKSKGAAGAIIIDPLVPSFGDWIVSVGTKSQLYYPRKDPGYVNFIFLHESTAKDLFKKWEIEGLIKAAAKNDPLTNYKLAEISSKFEFDYSKEKKEVKASNVIGLVEGTDKKDEFLFITAHYDHLGKRNGKIYHGADDDGSGTCGVLEIASAFAKAKAEGKGPRRKYPNAAPAKKAEGHPKNASLAIFFFLLEKVLV